MIVPQFPIDQPLVGQSIAEAGAGLVFDQETPVKQLRVAITALLEDDAYARAAKSVGERLRAHNGTTAAADRVNAVLDRAVTYR